MPVLGTQRDLGLRRPRRRPPGHVERTAVGSGRDALEGGKVPPSSTASLCPAGVFLTASASFSGICNRQ